MKARIYPLLEEAIEVGVRRGYRRAFKHVDSPTEGAIIDNIADLVMSEILDRFILDNDSL